MKNESHPMMPGLSVSLWQSDGQRGGSVPRRADKLAYTILGWRRFIPAFTSLTLASVYTGIEAIKQANHRYGRPFKQNTLFDHVAILKRFLLWMIENEYSALPEKKIKAIKTPRKDAKTKTASQLLTPEEVQTLIKYSRSFRDRAMIMTLYEGGVRPGELCQITWGDLKSDSKGIAVNVNFKTGITRYIRLVMAKKYIAEWRADYPLPFTDKSPVFLSEIRKPLTWHTIAVQLRRIAKRAGMTKHLTPHLFRHSRITHLLQEGAKESTVKLMMWGSLSTDMLTTYAHLTGRDIDADISRLYGLDEATTGKKNARLEPRVCPSCNLINPPGEDYCRGCMEALSPDAIADEEAIRRFVISHPRMFRKYLDEIKQNNLHSAVEKI
ncbi:MAG: site-specific integrase [Methanolinea sp.]|nr:site-specific integrase [Methanolinea sp.]